MAITRALEKTESRCARRARFARMRSRGLDAPASIHTRFAYDRRMADDEYISYRRVDLPFASFPLQHVTRTL